MHTNYFILEKSAYICTVKHGGLAQLARALAWHARGHEFDSRILHKRKGNQFRLPFFVCTMRYPPPKSLLGGDAERNFDHPSQPPLS